MWTTPLPTGPMPPPLENTWDIAVVADATRIVAGVKIATTTTATATAVTATVNGVETERGMTIVGRHGLLIEIGAATGITTDGGNRPREIGSCPTQSEGDGKGAGRETAYGIQHDQEAISEVTGRSYVVSHLYASDVY